MQPSLSVLAEKLYQNEFRAVLKRRVRGFVWLIAGQWAVAIVLAICYTPAGLTARAPLLAAVVIGGAFSLPPIALAMWRPGAVSTRHAAVVFQSPSAPRSSSRSSPPRKSVKGPARAWPWHGSVVVEKHGGTLTFQTALGRGTTFFVRIPHTQPAGLTAKAA